MNNKVTVIGSYNTDFIIQSKRIPAIGETVIGGKFSQGSGGKGANQAVAASRAGGKVSFISRIGADVHGDDGLQRLTEELINTHYVVRDANSPTGVAFILVDERGENSIVVASGANAQLHVTDIENGKTEIQSSKVLLVQLESPLEPIAKAMQFAREHGITVILNPAPAQALNKTILSSVDIITPNKIEAEMITGIKVVDEASLQRICKKFFEFGITYVLITLGSQGVFFGSTHSMELIPAYKVQTIDSTGAGDVFNGSLAAFLSEGMVIENAVQHAIAAAAISITRLGAQHSAPHRAEIEKFISQYSTSEIESIK
ncbi:MAG: ribokinase [Bacteroidetes bacterium]|nr:ribokinase [Bacteroidota bacterium]